MNRRTDEQRWHQHPIFLDAALALMERGDFDEGLRLASRCLSSLCSSLDDRSWQIFCQRVRSRHPMARLFDCSPLVGSLRRCQRAHPGASAAEIWERAHNAPRTLSDDIVGLAIDSYLRALPLAHPGAWNPEAQERGFLECFLALDFCAPPSDARDCQEPEHARYA